MHERKGFWDKNAGRYDRFMRNDRAAYEKMYGLIRPVVKAKNRTGGCYWLGAFDQAGVQHRKEVSRRLQNGAH